MTIPRLYLDEDVNPLLARILAERGHDVLTTYTTRRTSTSDRDQLTFAVHEERAFLTHNVAHFAVLAAQYRGAGWEHHGIILSEQLPLKELLARTLRLLDRRSAESLRNQVIWLQDFR